MIRSMAVICGAFCTATLASQILGLAFLWHRGQVTSETLRDLRLLLSGREPAAFTQPSEAGPPQPSAEEVMQARLGRVFDIASREEELTRFQAMIAETADGLAERQAAFERRKQAFEAELRQLRDTAESEATEQARAILQALPPGEAVASLMPLPLEEIVLLLKGMPEKSIARILKEFAAGDEQQVERGHRIFEAISRGQPERGLVEAAERRAAAPLRNQPAAQEPGSE